MSGQFADRAWGALLDVPHPERLLCGPLPASLPSEPSGHVSAQRRLFPPPGAKQPGRSPSGILRLQPACFFACLLGLQRPMEEEQRLKPTMPGVVQAEGAAMDAWALGSGQLAPLPRALPAVPGQSFLRSRGAAWKAVGLSRALRSVGT